MHRLASAGARKRPNRQQVGDQGAGAIANNHTIGS
jgi:hypothetical protein